MYLFCLFAFIYLCIVFSLSADLIMLGKQSLHFRSYINRSSLIIIIGMAGEGIEGEEGTVLL